MQVGAGTVQHEAGERVQIVRPGGDRCGRGPGEEVPVRAVACGGKIAGVRGLGRRPGPAQEAPGRGEAGGTDRWPGAPADDAGTSA
ncbi:hypothetical protein GCM10009731_21500 [Streptomyces globosus]